MIRVKYLAAFVFIFTVGLVPLAAKDHGKVKIRVEDFSGAPIPAHITITEVGTKKVAALAKSTEQKEAFATVPFGRYIVAIEAPGFRTRERRLNVLGPAAYMRVGLVVANADEQRVVGRQVFPFIRSVLELPLPQNADLWAKLVPITGPEDDLLDAKIGKDGNFQFNGTETGDYLLMILDGHRVLATEQVSAVGNKVVRIKLPQR